MISYHGIVGYGSGKTTLPSVETWGTNMNLLRDPPKSIHTRKIDKVGETSEITQMIQDSGDRACEAINVYARGVNPMVAVSYDNYGNNGGQRSGGTKAAGMIVGQMNSGKQAYLPYRILDRGAFRPPIRDQRDLLPLSRLPRVWTSSFSQPGFADFSKKIRCHGTDQDTKGVKKPEQMLKACVRPTATYQIETPIVEPYEVKYVIKNPIQVEGRSGIQPIAKFRGEIGTPVKQINEDLLHPEIVINQSGEYSQNIDTSNIDTSKYTHEMLYGDMTTNSSKNVQLTSIEEIYGVDTSTRTRDIQNISYTAPFSGHEKHEYIHSDIDLERSLPYHESRTNNGRNIHLRQENQINEREYRVNRPVTFAETNVGVNSMINDGENTREYHLKPTINAGGFDGRASIPSVDRENQITDGDTEKNRMRQRVFNMQQDRNLDLRNIPYMVNEIPV